jgi:hypothetical protein
MNEEKIGGTYSTHGNYDQFVQNFNWMFNRNTAVNLRCCLRGLFDYPCYYLVFEEGSAPWSELLVSKQNIIFNCNQNYAVPVDITVYPED